MLFNQVIGQHKLKQHLIETFAANRTAHAQIFLGQEGSGALALALAYAQYLMCENQRENDSCGECPACRKIQKNIHPDLHFSYPTIGTGKISNDYLKEWREIMTEIGPYLQLQEWLQKLGAENQQGNINKNECLDIVRKFTLTRVEGRYKILILWLPEFLDKEGNRLLKLIEEPEPNTVFILVAERAEKILNTILSRCQLVKVPQLDDEELAEAMMKRLNADENKARQLAYLSNGNFTKARQLFHDLSGVNDWSALFTDWLRACYQGKESIIYWAEYLNTGKYPLEKEGKKEIGAGRKEQILLLQYGLFFLRELSFFKMTGEPSRTRFNEAEQKTALGLAKILSIEQIDSLQQMLNKSIYFVERNANGKILFADIGLQIHRIFRGY